MKAYGVSAKSHYLQTSVALTTAKFRLITQLC